MNKHVQSMKNAITNYHKTVKSGYDMIAANNRKYKPEIAKEENEKIMAQLQKDLEAVKGLIVEAQDAGRHDADAWGKPDPAKITDDARLLEYDAVSPEEFRSLVSKYENNSTMLQLLANYAEKKNGGVGGFESVWNYGGKGNAARTSKHYDTTGLPTADAKRAAIDNYAAKAMSLADQIGRPAYNPVTGAFTMGNGPDSTFVKAALDAFGEDAG